MRHAGTASTGRRSTSLTRKRNDREPAPITIEARSATAHGPEPSRISSTASLLARCAEAGPCAGIRPPRYTIRPTPAVWAARAKFSAARRSRTLKAPSVEGSIEWIR